MQLLPFGIHDFEEIRRKKFLYIDKTEQILRLIQIPDARVFFFSRPRRFGKSLLISTLAAIFEGKKALFQGLFIENRWDWQKQPVIRLDFNHIQSDSPQTLKSDIIRILKRQIVQYQLDLPSHIQNPASYLDELIFQLYHKTQQKVVVLVDEYDRPIIDHIEQLEIAEQNRNILKDVYAILKAQHDKIRFAFITGITKVSQVSVFSGLNNVDDLSMKAEFNDLVGMRQPDIESYFAPYLHRLSQNTSQKIPDLLIEIRAWYNGYLWGGKERIYNPFSLIQLFRNLEFRDYWFQSGTPSFLIKLILQQKRSLIEYEHWKVAEESLLGSYDLHTLDLAVLLFQTGYLSIIQKQTASLGTTYTLGYPNRETKRSFISHLLGHFLQKDQGELKPIAQKVRNALENVNPQAWEKQIVSLFAQIPYPLHLPKEAYYHSLFYMILVMAGADIRLEVMTDKGRIDAVLEVDKWIYIIEFKYHPNHDKLDTIADDALKQIKRNRYYEPYLTQEKDIYLVGMGFSGKDMSCDLELLETTS